MKIKKLLMTAALMLFGSQAFAANHYIRAAAAGSHTGADWTNAWTSIAQVTWTRGDVYYIAGGSYGGFTLTTGNSGSTVIEIRGAAATPGDHGTSTGWSDAFDTQVGFTGSTITTGFWTINGQAEAGCAYPVDNTACYRIKFTNTNTGISQALQWGTAGATSTPVMEYIEVLGSNVHSNSVDEGIQCTPGPCSNININHSYVHNVGCDLLSFNENTGSVNNLFEYNWLAYNNNGPTPAAHCQAIQSTLASMIMRYNVFQDIQSSGAITDAAGGNASITEWDIYGNIFFWDAAWNAAWSGNGAVGYDDGLVGIFSLPGGTAGVLRIYNNTIYGLGLANSQNCNGQAYTINAGMAFATVDIRNNLWSNFTNDCNAGSSGPGTYALNVYHSIANGTKDSGTGSYVSSPALLVSPTSSTIGGFALISDTHTGTTLSSPYNVDMLSVIRGSNGTWDLGALQIAGGGGSPHPPTGFGAFVIN